MGRITHKRLKTCVHVHVHTYTYTHTLTHIYAYTHIQLSLLPHTDQTFKLQKSGKKTNLRIGDLHIYKDTHRPRPHHNC